MKRLASSSVVRSIASSCRSSSNSSRSYSSSSPLVRPSSTSPSTSASHSSGYGQPLPSTHPHLLATGDLTPGISAKEYASRRKVLMDNLEEGSIVIVAGGRMKYMSGQIFYKFRQASNFWYLTGFEEPDCVLILEKTSCSKGHRMIMFVRPKDATDGIWNGPRSGKEGATSIFGADEAVDIAQFNTRLKSILHAPTSSSSPIYVDVPGVSPSTRFRNRQIQPKKSMFEYLIPSTTSSADFDDLSSLLNGNTDRPIRSAATEIENKYRVIKSEAELKMMRKAADISSSAHAAVMRFASPTEASNVTETSLVAHFEYLTSLSGSPRAAYVPVCASGKSALTIHYTDNNLPLVAGDLVLFDAGCENAGYASDITRTWPVSGSFTPAQRDLYEAVLSVEKDCIKLCTVADGMSLDELHNKSCELMRIELKNLGFNLGGGIMERTLYPHFLSHPLGIDLHDTGSFGRNEKFRAGMVITVEPGVYVPPHPSFPKAFHGLAIRIEDEVAITESGDCVILSVNAPKEVVDVEACCQGLFDRTGR